MFKNFSVSYKVTNKASHLEIFDVVTYSMSDIPGHSMTFQRGEIFKNDTKTFFLKKTKKNQGKIYCLALHKIGNRFEKGSSNCEAISAK